MANVIYEPKGRAYEYSPLAVNLYTGCLYACKYCFAPGICHKKRSTFHTEVEPRKDILEKLEADCKKMKGDPRDILLCFTSDAYQPIGIKPFSYHAICASLALKPESDELKRRLGDLDRINGDITREALLILEKYEMRVSILTKGGMRASRDFDILARNDWKFGTTLLFWDEDRKERWEPNSPSIINRCTAILNANAAQIYTWVSVEPVINPTEALMLILELRDTVDHFKIGKINYHKYIEDKIDWRRFRRDVEALLFEKNYYLKKDLIEVSE